MLNLSNTRSSVSEVWALPPLSMFLNFFNSWRRLILELLSLKCKWHCIVLCCTVFCPGIKLFLVERPFIYFQKYPEKNGALLFGPKVGFSFSRRQCRLLESMALGRGCGSRLHKWTWQKANDKLQLTKHLCVVEICTLSHNHVHTYSSITQFIIPALFINFSFSYWPTV